MIKSIPNADAGIKVRYVRDDVKSVRGDVMGTCFIIGAGAFGDGNITKGEADMIIACDGGLAHCRRRGITPDIIIGDFDSLGFVPEGANVIRLPVEKDMTDMEAAVSHAKSLGYRKFHIFGATGGRLSHTLGNIALMAGMAADGLEVCVQGEGLRLYAISNSRLELPETSEGLLSVFSLSDKSHGVTISGVRYTLEDAALKKESALGEGNMFTGDKPVISVADGTLLVIHEYSPAWVLFRD